MSTCYSRLRAFSLSTFGAMLLVALGLSAHAELRGGAAATPADWVEGTESLDDGATRDFYNRAAGLSWENQLGDWRDSVGTPQGALAYATVAMSDDDTPERITWDVAQLVQEWVDGTFANQGMLLRLLSGDSTYRFRSREYSAVDERPWLEVVTSSGTIRLDVIADTYISTSTFQGFGDRDHFDISGSANSLLRFDLSGFSGTTTILGATLGLHVYAEFGSSTIGVYRSSQGHAEPASDPVLGIASQYHADVGIAAHPSVYLAADFESLSWGDQWSYGTTATTLELVDNDPARLFEPLAGKALRSRLPKGGQTGLNVGYRFLEESGSEPEEVYFRYYFRVGEDWQTQFGGKLPGLAGRYGVAGWGGRPSNGTNGWSARGTFQVLPPSGNPLGNQLPIGNYVYHADMTSNFGDVHLWLNDYRGFLQKNRWYSIEQYVKLNTPGSSNGITRAWVDGRLAWEKTDWRFRDVDTLRVEEVWLNIFHGGTTAITNDAHSYLDNVVIASEYIGPALFDGLFADDFELGNTEAWTSASP